ncbi:hypothetical protein DMH02_002550 [Streptomyces sp. WAC 00631]|nr:hypothetical protein [Streptomyces sp. WAC 00631]MCC5032168.1 hypothetical protein [Streptomyces sp. WAC 00631]
MESGPAIFAGTVFVLFGAALLVWAGTRLRSGAPVVEGVSSPLPVPLVLLFGPAALLTGGWLLLSA